MPRAAARTAACPAVPGCSRALCQAGLAPGRAQFGLGRAEGGALLPPGAAVSTGVCNTGALSRQSLSPARAVGWREREKRHAIVMAAAKAERQRRQTRAYDKQTVDRFRGASFKE